MFSFVEEWTEIIIFCEENPLPNQETFLEIKTAMSYSLKIQRLGQNDLWLANKLLKDLDATSNISIWKSNMEKCCNKFMYTQPYKREYMLYNFRLYLDNVIKYIYILMNDKSNHVIKLLRTLYQKLRVIIELYKQYAYAKN